VSALSWVTPSLQLLCIIGVVICQHASRLAAVIWFAFLISILFAAMTATFLAITDQSNSCSLTGQFGLIAVVSYDFVLCNTMVIL